MWAILESVSIFNLAYGIRWQVMSLFDDELDMRTALRNLMSPASSVWSTFKAVFLPIQGEVRPEDIVAHDPFWTGQRTA